MAIASSTEGARRAIIVALNRSSNPVVTIMIDGLDLAYDWVQACATAIAHELGLPPALIGLELSASAVGHGFPVHFDRWDVLQLHSLRREQVDAHVAMALDAGINLFDTANVYGDGEAEALLGAALEGKRQSVLIASKVRGRVGPGPNMRGLPRQHIMQQVEASLTRLKTDYLDIYQVHGADEETPWTETLRALDDLVRQGKVRYIGCSNLAAWRLMKALSVSDRLGLERFVSYQGYYSLAARDMDRELIPALQDEDLGLMAWSPLAGGLLTGKATTESSRPRSQLPAADEIRADAVITELRHIAAARGVSLARVALRWLLEQPAVATVLVGARTTDQLADNIAAAQ